GAAQELYRCAHRRIEPVDSPVQRGQGRPYHLAAAQAPVTAVTCAAAGCGTLRPATGHEQSLRRPARHPIGGARAPYADIDERTTLLEGYLRSRGRGYAHLRLWRPDGRARPAG